MMLCHSNSIEIETLNEHHLILGGCGFIGRHVAILLARTGFRVTLVDRGPLAHSLLAESVNRITHQMLELGSADWDTILANVDVVHHYAWGSLPASANANPGGDLRTNLGTTIDLLDALHRRGGGRVIFASSGGTVYGKLRQIPVPEDHVVAPITAYGAGKATAELYLGLYRAMHGLDCRIARIANPYGAGQKLDRGQGAVTTFLHRALSGQPITIWGTGEVVRDYVHIADVAKCLVALAITPRTQDFIFNVGSGVGTSLNDIVIALETRLGRKLDVKRSETRTFDVPISVLSIDRARVVLGWSPRLSFAQGIDRTLEDLHRDSQLSDLS
jgi:UDP-glucose 4-epimerase